MNKPKKYAVHYESRFFGKSYIHIFADSAEEAVQYIEQNGVGNSRGKVIPDTIVGVEEVGSVREQREDEPVGELPTISSSDPASVSDHQHPNSDLCSCSHQMFLHNDIGECLVILCDCVSGRRPVSSKSWLAKEIEWKSFEVTNNMLKDVILSRMELDIVQSEESFKKSQFLSRPSELPLSLVNAYSAELINDTLSLKYPKADEYLASIERHNPFYWDAPCWWNKRASDTLNNI